MISTNSKLQTITLLYEYFQFLIAKLLGGVNEI